MTITIYVKEEIYTESDTYYLFFFWRNKGEILFSTPSLQKYGNSSPHYHMMI